jgi:hypothetical protein
MTITHLSDAAERQYRHVRDLERDTHESDVVRNEMHAEPGHSPLSCSDPRADNEPTAENG